MSHGSGTGGPAPRVLIVDDVPRVLAAMRDLLEMMGMDVVGEAGDGAAGVAVAALVGPDVVLMDPRMPVMDGLEATRRIRRLGLGCQVVVRTAFDGPAIHDEAKTAGAFEVIAKGEHPGKVIDLVERAWRARHAATHRWPEPHP